MSSPGPSPRDKEPLEHRRGPKGFQLTEEEKSVLVECRRNSIARGLPLGVAAALTLRWFIHQGRVPSHVKRWTGLYYTGAFLGSFYVGVASYKQTCMDKIMALDNSFLKQQLKTNFADVKNMCEEEIQKSSSRPQRERAYPPPRHTQTPSTRSPSPPDVSLREGPAINTGYEKDKAMLETREPTVEQPDAFTGGNQAGSDLSQSSSSQPSYQQSQPSKRRGRTYDDIRESARQQYQEDEPRSASRSRGQEEEDWRQQQQQRGRRVVRKNKYGDDIEE